VQAILPGGFPFHQFIMTGWSPCIIMMLKELEHILCGALENLLCTYEVSNVILSALNTCCIKQLL